MEPDFQVRINELLSSASERLNQSMETPAVDHLQVRLEEANAKRAHAEAMTKQADAIASLVQTSSENQRSQNEFINAMIENNRNFMTHMIGTTLDALKQIGDKLN